MNNRIRYTFDEVQCAAFYQLPKFLLEGEFENLSNDARVLYTLLRDRHELSIKNDWYNEKGEVYFIMTRAEMESMLKLSPKTTRKVIKELKTLNLIDEQRRGKMQPNLIYLLKVKTTRSKPGKTPLCDREKVTVMSGKNSPSRAVKNPPHEREKFPSININHNQTDFNNTDYQSIHRENEPDPPDDGLIDDKNFTHGNNYGEGEEPLIKTKDFEFDYNYNTFSPDCQEIKKNEAVNTEILTELLSNKGIPAFYSCDKVKVIAALEILIPDTAKTNDTNKLFLNCLYQLICGSNKKIKGFIEKLNKRIIINGDNISFDGWLTEFETEYLRYVNKNRSQIKNIIAYTKESMCKFVYEYDFIKQQNFGSESVPVIKIAKKPQITRNENFIEEDIEECSDDEIKNDSEIKNISENERQPSSNNIITESSSSDLLYLSLRKKQVTEDVEQIIPISFYSKYSSESDWQLIREIKSIIFNVLIFGGDSYKILDEDISAFIVQRWFRKIKTDHIEYVIGELNNNPTELECTERIHRIEAMLYHKVQEINN